MIVYVVHPFRDNAGDKSKVCRALYIEVAVTIWYI